MVGLTALFGVQYVGVQSSVVHEQSSRWRGGDGTDRLREQNPAGWSSRPGHAGSAFEPPSMVAEGLRARTWLPRCHGDRRSSPCGRLVWRTGLGDFWKCRPHRPWKTLGTAQVTDNPESWHPPFTGAGGYLPPRVRRDLRGWDPAGTVARWLACVTQHHVLQVRPCCGRCPCVLVYGCDIPLCGWTPPFLHLSMGSRLASTFWRWCLPLPLAPAPSSCPPHCSPAAPQGPLWAGAVLISVFTPLPFRHMGPGNTLHSRSRSLSWAVMVWTLSGPPKVRVPQGFVLEHVPGLPAPPRGWPCRPGLPPGRRTGSLASLTQAGLGSRPKPAPPAAPLLSTDAANPFPCPQPRSRLTPSSSPLSHLLASPVG